MCRKLTQSLVSCALGLGCQSKAAALTKCCGGLPWQPPAKMPGLHASVVALRVKRGMN